jgi:hypothetical protein
MLEFKDRCDLDRVEALQLKMNEFDLTECGFVNPIFTINQAKISALSGW